ncbi:hypothetical protein DTO280E4_3006 [Paecilomyces variotii]|nr:hypothetical protein DTO169E5_2442 [Paecilomyces variotii]KAJ9260646.1 hypothetical protein DTO195F2_4486 [Paecilomyces variotii]KAJ9362971.1 hypothetical protein DTO280E4_3006 [Paecilomyces variotii]KAJ9408529.1 hypothetical protein DTO045G8_3822 [Paecilomyces variotii]
MGSISITRASHSLNHEKEFKHAVEKIESAVQNALTSDKKYENVGVLSLRWVNDDLNLGQIETELLDTFKTTFNYATESYIIPATSYNAAATGVKRKLGSFMAKYDNASSLAIVIYQGHSHYAQHGIVPQQLVLFGSSNPAAPAIPWSFIEANLSIEGDTLAILDSCFSSAAAMTGLNTEYLVASAFESPASAIIQRSFTRRLIDLFKSQINPEMTVAQIHAKLVNQANQPGSGLDYTFVHIACDNKQSITLRPLRHMPRELAALKKGDELADGKVLVSVLLEGKTSIPSVSEWETWLARAIPEDVADIKIEAVFETGSALCLMTMPIAVFDMLKGHNHEGAYGFVAYVESNNLMNTHGFRSQASGFLTARQGNVQMPRREPKPTSSTE